MYVETHDVTTASISAGGRYKTRGGRSQRRVRRVYMGRVAEAERSARATEPTTPLDTLGRSCAETGEAGRGAWEATEVAGLPETRNSVEFTGRVHSGLSAIRIATPARRLYARKRDTGLQRSELGARYGTYHPPRHPRWSTPEPNLR